MRETKGPSYKIPDFDPLDGDIGAEVASLPQLRFVGRKALHAQVLVERCRPEVSVSVITMPRPSLMFINRAAGNQDLVLAALRGLSLRPAESNA